MQLKRKNFNEKLNRRTSKWNKQYDVSREKVGVESVKMSRVGVLSGRYN